MTKLAYTILAVRDLPRARKFYQDFFTQSVAVDMGKLIGFESGLALWEQDDMAEQSGLDAGILSGRGGMEIEFHTDDIEDLFQRLLSAGVEILHPVRAHPWGQLVFRCRDLDGHCIEVDEYLWVTARRLAEAGQSVEDIARRFGVAPQAVTDMLKD
ncbi:MAG: VOC family protein [Bacillota bacterium]|jgi:catechol 2,3-dioxygenase-like lactoylglutathione lyase family enzyme